MTNKAEIIPTREEAKAELAKAKEVLDSYGIENSIDPEAPIDWVDYIDKAQDRIGKSGSGQRSGSIILTDSYPINRTLYLDAHVTLEGAVRAKFTMGGSHGFYIDGDDFDGEFMLEWRKPTSRHRGTTVHNYSNFGAGIHQVHVQSKPGTSGVYFRGAQQSCRVDNLIVRGFGENAIGIQLAGDTYTVRDTFSDASKSGEKSQTREGSTGFKLKDRVYSLALNNITTHNCAYGIEWSDAHQLLITNFESELTETPLRSTYQSMGVTIRNASFRHTDWILDIAKARFPNDYQIKLDGMMADHKKGVINYPINKTWESSKLFDVTIIGEGKGLKVIDHRKSPGVNTVPIVDSGSHPAAHICSGSTTPPLHHSTTPEPTTSGCCTTTEPTTSGCCL